MGAGAEVLLEARDHFEQVADFLKSPATVSEIQGIVESAQKRAEDEGTDFRTALSSMRINPYPYTK